MKLEAYTDGGSDGNGEAYVGVALLDPKYHCTVREISERIGKGTNNEAEYSAVLMALYAAIEEGAKHLTIYCDSKLVVNQVSGLWNVHENHIKDYHAEVIRQKEYIDFDIRWIPRAENKVADRLSRLCR